MINPPACTKKAASFATLISASIALAATAQDSPVEGADSKEISIGGFADIVKHWNDKYGRDRKDQSFTASQFRRIADNIVEFQNEDGGWSKSVNPLLNLRASELKQLLVKSIYRSTFDNRTTYTHIDYLAKVYDASNDAKYKAAAERGLDYVFREQRGTGGFPGADVDAVTFNDDVMVGVMQLLKRIRDHARHFDWLDNERRRKAANALERAVDVTLKCQIVVDGVKTAWCQQHSHETFRPVKARSYELPAICPVESTRVVQFLMMLDEPSREVRDAIESAVTWIDQVALNDIRVRNIAIPPVRYENHTATRDRVVVQDIGAPPIWARYYEIGTNRPFFCNRDGTVVYSLAEVHHERRSGYAWYSSVPRQLVDRDYPSWRAKTSSKKQNASYSDEQLIEIRNGFESRRDQYLTGYLKQPLYKFEDGVTACRDQLQQAKWIWHADHQTARVEPHSEQPIGRRYFRRSVTLPPDQRIRSAHVAIAIDNSGELQVNGSTVGRASGFHRGNLFDVTKVLREGENVMSILADNLGDAPNPAGIIAVIHVEFEQAASLTVATDRNWQASIDGRHWVPAVELGSWGCQPWGRVAISLETRVNQYVFSRLCYALSSLCVGTDIDGANRAVIEAVAAVQRERQSGGEFGLHWMGAAFSRVYFLFGPDGTHGRKLSEKAISDILNLFATWARTGSRIVDANPELTWRVWGSENHSAQRDATCWAAARIISASPLADEFRYEDGSTAVEQLAAWQSFLKRYFRERISRGMLVEISPSGYGSRTLQGWHNVYDFAVDRELKSLAKSTLDIWWADWAQEQLGGMRGGGKTRLYPGVWALSKSDRNRAMSWFYLGQGKPAHQHETLPVIATTSYRLPLVVMDIALDPVGRGVYECKSRRPGRYANYELSQTLSKPNEPIYDVDSEDGGILRYSYCTPDFILGCLMFESRPEEYWTAISQQNRWHGVIFSGPEDSTLYPRCETDRSTYNAHWAIQNKGTLIAQKLRHAKNAKDMRVYFSADLVRHEFGGWIFAQASQAFAAVRIVEGSWSWDNDRWLRCDSEYTPVIIEVARSQEFDNNFDSFQRAILARPVRVEDGVLRYQGLNGSGDFTFYAKSDRSPELDGATVDLTPEYTFFSPFLREDWASGVVRIGKNSRELVIDVRN